MSNSNSSSPASSYSFLPLHPGARIAKALQSLETKQDHGKSSSDLDIISMDWSHFFKILSSYKIIYSSSNSVVRTSVHSSRILKSAATRDIRTKLAHEAHIHQQVLAVFDAAPKSVRSCVLIPKLYHPAPQPGSKRQGRMLKCLPAARFEEQAYGIVMERIRPVPWNLREFLCQEHPGVRGEREPGKRSCLVSVYLGATNALLDAANVGGRASTELCLTQHELRREDLPLQAYTRALADALATLHWRACLDGQGVKFVLGRPRPRHFCPIIQSLLPDRILGRYESLRQDADYDPSAPEKTLALWMFDFNRCSPIEHTHQSVRRLGQIFWNGEPWFPRPPTRARADELWEIFAARYLATASMMVADADLPKMFIGEIERGMP